MSDYMAQQADDQIEAGKTEYERMVKEIDQLKEDKRMLLKAIAKLKRDLARTYKMLGDTLPEDHND